jgi:hypothetical protein
VFIDDYIPVPDPLEIGWVHVQSTSLVIICASWPKSQPLSMQERRVVRQSPVLVAERIHAYYQDDLQYAIEVQGDCSSPRCDPSVCCMEGCPSYDDPTD